jgi:hypothetical protein
MMDLDPYTVRYCKTQVPVQYGTIRYRSAVLNERNLFNKPLGSICLVLLRINLVAVLMSATFAKRYLSPFKKFYNSVVCSVADPNTVSDAFLTPGSGIQIQNPGCKKIRIRIEHPGSHGNLETICWVENT